MLKQGKKAYRRRAGGFTLMEALFAIVIVGLGVVAMMQLFTSGTEVNAYGNKLSAAVIFAEQVRAQTDETDFLGLPARDDEVFAGSGELLDYQVQLNVEAVTPEDMTVYVGPDPEMYRITALVTANGKEVTRMRWLRNR